MSGNVSPIELTWTGVAVIWFVLSLWFSLWLGRRDLNDVKEGIKDVPPRAVAWGPRWWSALQTIVVHLAFAVLFWTPFIIIGLVAMRYPPPPPSPDQSVSARWLGYLFLVAEFGGAFIQAWMLYVRYKIEHAVPVPISWRTPQEEGHA